MHTLLSIWLGRCATVALLICSFSLALQAQTPPAAPAGMQTSIQPSIACSQPPTFDPTQVNFLAGDITSPLVQQIDVDCFAWQSFIAFNWPVDAGWPTDPTRAGEPDRTVQAKDWGTPQDPTKMTLRPAAWETFKPVSDIFVAPGQTPTAWGVFSNAAQCSAATQPGVNALSSHKLLTHTAKAGQLSPRRRSAILGKASGQGLGLGPNQINEAFGGWLTDQNGQLVWYELATNRAEFAYLLSPDGVSSDALYTQTGQTTVATNANNKHPNGLAFPVGQPPSGGVIQTWDQLGAAEIKAAWRILTNLPQQWPHYHLSQAWLLDPVTQQCGQEVLGLVGLHIIRNTATFPNFFWATFEHVDNAPQPTATYADPYTHPFGFSFYNPNCTVNCTPNQPRVDSKGKPLFPKNQPVQVTRQFPISTQLAQLNLGIQQAIQTNNPRSIYQYYQLVNVLWDQSPTLPITSSNRAVPLNTSSMVSEGPNSPVANTTMETYVQSTTCVACHAGATIAGSNSLASDFSFTFLDTQSGSQRAGKRKATKSGRELVHK
jgi:hypothetical protein